MERGIKKEIEVVDAKAALTSKKVRVYAGAKLSNQGLQTDVGYPKFYVPT